MDIWQILNIGIRRWKVTVPLLIIGVTLGWVYSGAVAPVYKANATLLYLPPSASVTDLAQATDVLDPSSPDFDPNAGEIVTTHNPFASSLRTAVLATELYMGSQQ